MDCGFCLGSRWLDAVSVGFANCAVVFRGERRLGAAGWVRQCAALIFTAFASRQPLPLDHTAASAATVLRLSRACGGRQHALRPILDVSWHYRKICLSSLDTGDCAERFTFQLFSLFCAQRRPECLLPTGNALHLRNGSVRCFVVSFDCGVRPSQFCSVKRSFRSLTKSSWKTRVQLWTIMLCEVLRWTYPYVCLCVFRIINRCILH